MVAGAAISLLGQFWMLCHPVGFLTSLRVAKDVGSSSLGGGWSYGGHVSREEICTSYILKGGKKFEG